MPEGRMGFAQHRALKLCRLPCFSGIRTNLYFYNLSAAAPGNTPDLYPAARYALRIRWEGDDRPGIHFKTEHPDLVFDRVSVFRSLLTCHIGLVRNLYSPDPFDIHVAFPARQEQAGRITLFRSHGLTILRVCDHGIIPALRHGNASGHDGRVRTLCQEPGSLSIYTNLPEQGRQHHARPFALAGEPQNFLRGQFFLPATKIPGALQEADLCNRWKALKICQCKLHWPVYHAMYQQFILLRINDRYTGMVPLIMQV